VLGKDGRTHETPVLSTRIVDRTGAGDALYALTSPCVYKQVPTEVVGFIGCCAGAMKVETVCNREPINPVILAKFVNGVLK
jgi:sugar/nucleoside kinase (ribokinase family)